MWVDSASVTLVGKNKSEIMFPDSGFLVFHLICELVDLTRLINLRSSAKVLLVYFNFCRDGTP